MAGHSPRADRRGDRPPRAGGGRDHGDDADGRRGLGRRRARPPLRPAGVVVHAHGDRRQPLGDPARPPGHRPPEDPGQRLLLPRQRRRDVRGRSTTDGNASRAPGTSARRSTSRQTTRVVEYNDVERLARALAHGDVAVVLMEPALTNIGIVLPEPGYLEAVRALTPRARHAAHQRRDAHVLGRPRRCDPRLGARAGHRHDRQVDRRRDPDRRLRHLAGARGRDRAPTSRPTSRTSAASAARWPATRSRSAAARATLEYVLTDDAFERMTDRATALHRGRPASVIERRPAVVRLPARRPRRVPLRRRRAAQRHGVGARPPTTSSTTTCTSTSPTAAY